jgi:hypothetical protein
MEKRKREEKKNKKEKQPQQLWKINVNERSSTAEDPTGHDRREPTKTSAPTDHGGSP